MSKAFLRESDQPEILEPPRLVPRLPAGTKNLMTAEGATRLRERLQDLAEGERPSLAARLSDPDARQELKILDAKIRQIQDSLSSAEVVVSASGSDGVVRFGSVVQLRTPEGNAETYRIVGVDETDFFADALSWQSPLAKALLNAREGQTVNFQAPRGLRQLVVLKVE